MIAETRKTYCLSSQTATFEDIIIFFKSNRTTNLLSVLNYNSKMVHKTAAHTKQLALPWWNYRKTYYK